MKKALLAALLAVTLLCACSKQEDTPASSVKTEESSQTVSSEIQSSAEESSKQESKKESKKEESSKKESSKQESSEKEESKKPESKASKPESSVQSKQEESSEPEVSEQTSVEPEPEASVPEEASVEPESSKEPESVKPVESSKPEESSKAQEISKAQESSKPQESSKAQESSKPAPQKKQDAPTGARVGASWFDDAVFVGDSVTLKLSYYAEDYGALGKADFLCAGSLGYTNGLWDLNASGNVHPWYNGVKYTIPEGLKHIGAKKIFIMLGMNDIGLYGVDGAVESMKTMTSRITQACPDAVLYVESVTPMLEDMQMRDLNNRTIAQFDQKIKAVCAERGYRYMDVASAVDDGRGNLVYSYCSDPTAMGLHFSNAGCEQWAEYLKRHVNDAQ